MKKIIALVLALAMVLMVGAAFASTITINRDASWDEDAEEKSVTFTYYKIFDATITTAAGVNADTGALTGSGNVVYTVDSAAKAAALPSIFTANLASDGLYYVTLTNSSTSAADIAAALKTMVETAANATLFPGTEVTSDANPVVIDNLDDAYYLILASNGKDAVVQTIGDVQIKEKNDYPTIDKKQKKAADPSYSETVVPEEIGSVIDYQVTVHIPADATKAIKVIDTMTAGLTYNGDIALDPNIAYTALASTDPDYVSGAAWQIEFSAATVQANRGEDIVITYTATVNSDAITDTGKENEVTLIYDEGNYVLKDNTEYEIYFGGIYKVDPNDASADMSGVKFELTSGSDDVNVTYDTTNGYYYVDPDSTSNEVETRAETVGTGDEAVTYYTIKIRGLDDDKTYTLTETETKAGYNLLNGTVNLTKTKDEGQAFDNKALNTFDRVENNKGTQLPSTGGIGTTIFYIIGGLLLVGAAVILVARKKAND